jgi:ferredoxin-NADP reductase
MKLTFDHDKEEADDIRTFFFTPEKPLNYTAGQYIELTIDHKNPDNRGIKRWFTLSSSPEDEFLTITTKFNFEKFSSFKKALLRLKQGDELFFNGPMGDFVLPKIIQTPLIFVAGGIGITPFHSILTWLSQTAEERPIQLIYAVKNEDEILFQETFDKANQHVSIIVSEPSAAWGGERGHISGELILGLADIKENSLVYVSGPEPMVESLEKELNAKGIKKSQLVLDFFPNYLSE